MEEAAVVMEINAAVEVEAVELAIGEEEERRADSEAGMRICV
jgi:hypothetical protein